MLDPGDSSLPGARAILTGIRNSAQSGTNLDIKIAQSDSETTPAKYVGRKILTVHNISAAAATRVGNPLDGPYTYTELAK